MLSLQQVTLTLSVGSLALLAYYVRNTVLVCRRALREFRLRSRGLPILDEGWNPVANHGIELHLGKNVCQKITRWHARHGKTFGWLYGERFCASTIDLDLIKLFAHDEQRVHINRMPFKSVLREFEEDNLFSSENEQWRRLRRVFGPALKKYKTPNMVAEIETAVESFLGHLNGELATSDTGELIINLNKRVHKFSLDVVFRCLYKQPGLIDYEQEKNYWVDVLDEALAGPIERPWPMRAGLAFPSLATPINWLVKRFTKVGLWFNEVHRFIMDQTKRALEARRQLIKLHGGGGGGGNNEEQLVVENFRLADGSEFKRFVVDYIIDQFLDGKCTRSEYANSSFFLLNAADKTVADALTHTLYFLAVHVECQQKLRHSLRLEGLDSTYLTWVLNESLRLHPPAALGCSRTVERDLELPGGGGGCVPSGSYVITPLNTIHRLPEYWGEDAHKFRPERWQDTSRHHPMQFLPFGAGLRVCPGRELALFEMRKLLLEAITQFNFQCEPKADIDTFDSPYMLYSLPNSPTFVRVTRAANV